MNRPHDFRHWKSVRLFGREYPVLDQVVVEQRTYLLLERLSSGDRERFLAVGTSHLQKVMPVAVIILPGTVNSQYFSILKRIASSNAHVPAICGCERRGDRTIVVLDWIRGITLSEYIRQIREQRLPQITPQLAWQRIRGLAHGLRGLHVSRRLVHGDIKPDNIVVSRDPGRFYLIDYGSAWGIERTAYREPGDGLSCVFAAPEMQSEGCFGSILSDQFSLSVVLYQLLTMQLPYANYGGRAGRPDYVAQMKSTLVMPSTLVGQHFALPRAHWSEIDRVVAKGLSLEPNDRYPTPESWIHALDEVDYLFRRPPALSPTKERLTGVVRWVAKQLDWWR